MEVFVIHKEDIDGRLDCFYYRPEFTSLEKKVLSKTSKTLGDFIIEIAGGATPRIEESEKYYTDDPNIGIPFLRVQNVSPEGLKLDDIKLITPYTHENLLKRSQVSEYDLITKITGVGRMAVSSVAPKDFIGNINQHLVVIKTQNYETSRVLATFLNTDIGEKLAKRRSTGGTRPALDYQALKTIPIIFEPRIIQIMDEAYSRKKQNEEEAERLYNSINDYILSELGIEKITFEIQNNFTIDSSHLHTKRIDPFYHQPIFEKNEQCIKNGKFDSIPLKEITELITSGQRPKGGVRNISEGIPSLGGEHINELGFVAQTELKYIPEEFHKSHLDSKIMPNDILLVKDGATTGKVGFIPEDYPFEEANINEHLFLIRVKNGFDPFYVFCFLKSSASQIQIKREITGATITGLVRDSVNQLLIPIPPLEIQKEISSEIKERMQRTEELKLEGSNYLEQAKKEVEKILFE